MQFFSAEDIQKIHDATMAILSRHGIVVHSERAREIFRQHNFKIDGTQVFFTEKAVMDAVDTVPASFTVRARNPEKNISIGTGTPVMATTAGNIYMLQHDGSIKPGEQADYAVMAKLAHTSSIPQVTAHSAVHPHDVPNETSHFDKFLLDVTLSDNPIMGNANSWQCTQCTLELLSLVFGDKQALINNPSCISVVTSLSPLAWEAEQIDSLAELARYGQPVAITNMLILGGTAPVDVAGALAMINAELLAGVVMSQLVNKGAPVIYGTTSCPLDMRFGTTSLGAPETLQIARGSIQLAKFYGLPARTGGSLTDANTVDGQATAESVLSLSNAVQYGVDFMLHSFGMMSSYMAVSPEKWILDEEFALLILASVRKPPVTAETLVVDRIVELGTSGRWLEDPSTLKNFRSLYMPRLTNKESHVSWQQKGSPDIRQKAREAVEKRLAEYVKPPIDEGLEKELRAWIDHAHKTYQST